MTSESLLFNNVQPRSISASEFLLSSNTLPSLVKKYLITCSVEGKSPATLQIYGNTLSYFLRYLQGAGASMQADQLTGDDVKLFLLSVKQRGRAPETLHVYYRSLKTFFNWLRAEEVITRHPMANVKPPKLPHKVIKPFSQEDLSNILLLCSGDRYEEVRDRAMVLLFLDTGMRASEMAGIRLQNVDLGKQLIKVMGKGAKERWVRMGTVTTRTLLRYLRVRRSLADGLWCSQGGRVLTAKGVQEAVARLARRAEVKDAKLGPHTFRHTAALLFLRNGGGQFQLQCMLGHSTLEMTRRYVSTLGVDEMARAHEKASPVDNLRL